MKSVPLILLLLFSLMTRAETGTEPSYLSHLEPLENARFISTPDQDHAELIKAFDEAKKSIYVGIYGISDSNIAKALSSAHKRGIKVVVVCDLYCSNNPKRLEIFNALKADGVEIYTATTGFTISHWKMFVIDEQKAFVSTMNFIVRTEQMRDVGVFVTNPAIVAEILGVFKSDVENAKNQTALTPALTHPNLVWSPNNSELKLNTLIGSARKTIEIWIENMGAKTIHDSLKAAVARGVKVRLLSSECGMGMPPAESFIRLKDLAQAGVIVQVMPFPATKTMPYIHAKTMTIDRETVFLGSENFSANSIQKARELGIIFQNKQIENKMNSLFESDWSASVSIPTAAPTQCSPLTVAI